MEMYKKVILKPEISITLILFFSKKKCYILFFLATLCT